MKPKNSNLNYYAVAKGRSTGIFNSWSECQRQVDGFKHNSFKGFCTMEGAIDFMRKAGIAIDDIDVVEEEGDVLLRKPLSAVMQNYVSDVAASNKNGAEESAANCDAKDNIESQGTEIGTVSIDGSCKGNGTGHAISGFGIYWGPNHPYNISERISKTENQSNQVAELTAAVRAVEQIREKGFKEMNIQTDSMYVCNGITSWVSKWLNNGWKTAQGNEVKHKELWQRLHEQCKLVTIHWKHVKGHAGNPENEAADQLANTATDENMNAATSETTEKEHRSTTVTEQGISESKLKTSSSQTYPAKMELQMEELLSAFHAMESQVLNVVKRSYEDQKESDAMVNTTEIARLQDKVVQLEDMLKKERKDKERVEKELRTISDKYNVQEKRGDQIQEFEEKQRKMKVQIQQLQEQVQKEKSLVKLQEESLSSLRKMSESTKTDLEFMASRLSQSNEEIQNLQEKNACLTESEMKLQGEIKELKRQICMRDDQLQLLQEDDGFQEVSQKRKKVTPDDSQSKEKIFNQNVTNEVVVVDGDDKDEIVEDTRHKAPIARVTDKQEENADVLIIGTSIIKDVDPGRMFRDRKVIKQVLEQKTIEGAKKYIDSLNGEFKVILLQVGSNDLEKSSPDDVERGIAEIIELLKVKQPNAKILVSGILPRWKKYAVDGMNFKNKKNALNDKMKAYTDCTFCPQDNFGRHMFYDGTHLNTEGTAQLVSNYKFMIGKTTAGPKRGDLQTYAEKVNKPGTRRAVMAYGQRANENGQRGGYRANEARRHLNVYQRHSYTEQKSGRVQSDGADKLQSLVKLLKDLIST